MSTPKEDQNNEKLNYLPDKPIESADYDEFKHDSIALTLNDCISSCPQPFTIGIFGSWGSGKTTLIKLLKKKLNPESTALVEIDVWKFEKESLRKNFLKELEKSLKDENVLLDSYEGLTERIDNSITKTYEVDFPLNKRKKDVQTTRSRDSLILFMCMVAIGFIITLIKSESIGDYFTTVFTSTSITAVVIVAVMSYLTDVYSITTETKGQENLNDPQGFQAEFEKLVNAVNKEKLIIVIDNLDRCLPDTAIELLSTVKTYLEPNSIKCIFIIPCDERKILEYINSKYVINTIATDKSGEVEKNNNIDFMRKFFSTYIYIPYIIGSDMEKYVESLLMSAGFTKDSLPPNLVTVLTIAFRKTPREIKQFINVLISHYELARIREETLLIEPGTITGNIAILAKVLVIKQLWPDSYDKLEQTKRFEALEKDTNELLVKFLESTKSINTTDLRPFVYFKWSEAKSAIPGGTELEIAIKDFDEETIKLILEEIKQKNTSDTELNKYLLELVEERTK